MRVSGTRMILADANGGIGVVLLDAGPDGLFNTADDRARQLTSHARSLASEVAVAGDWAAWLDTGAPGGDQVFLLHGLDGAPMQLTASTSAKGHLALDPDGRVHWLDAVMSPQAIMTFVP